MDRGKRKLAAEDTIDILNKGYYKVDGRKVTIDSDLSYSIENSVLLKDQDSKLFLLEPKTHSFSTGFTCCNESTVTAIHRYAHEIKEDIGVLNFASAKHPGGGFRTGAIAQEESLAISSGLYYTQTRNRGYYDINTSKPSPFYTNTSIYSPFVPFFRNENLDLVSVPSLASVLTLPAVNLNLAGHKKSSESQAFDIMKYRMRLCLAVFYHYGIEHIILGAFGCGVFKHSPSNVSLWWKELFEKEFKGQFKTVHFAVLDRSKKLDNIKFFEQMTKDLSMSLL